MATKKSRRRRSKSRAPSAMTVTLQPGEVPTDAELEAEAENLSIPIHPGYVIQSLRRHAARASGRILGRFQPSDQARRPAARPHPEEAAQRQPARERLELRDAGAELPLDHSDHACLNRPALFDQPRSPRVLWCEEWVWHGAKPA